MHLMGVMVRVAAQAAFRARAPVQAEEVFMVILVTREDIIINTAKGINSSNNPAIRATRSS